MLNDSAEATARNTALIGLILFGAYLLNYVFTALGVPQALAKLVSEMPLPPWAIMLLIIGFYLALGTFMEGFSMMITTIPVIFPVVQALGYDPIWFGVIVVMLVEIALISPPDGTVLYVLQGCARMAGRSPTSSPACSLHARLHPRGGDPDGLSLHRPVAADRDALKGPAAVQIAFSWRGSRVGPHDHRGRGGSPAEFTLREESRRGGFIRQGSLAIAPIRLIFSG